MAKGMIFDIQRFSVHDGTGIRTNVFFKGCPLRCDWCSNPESQLPQPQPMYDAKKCIGCGACLKACPQEAISTASEYRINVSKCLDCTEHTCAKACYATALTIAGQEYTVEEIVRIVERDAIFYGSSGGGITVSGGEGTMQIEFLVELLKCCKEKGINTSIETCSACGWDSIRQTLPYVDTYLCDVKHTNPTKIRQETGGDAEHLLSNIRKLAESGANIVARVPMIPGFNTDEEEVLSIGRFIADCGIRQVNLLNFHKLGVPKYTKCFMDRLPKDRNPLTQEELRRRLELLQGLGLEASIG